MNGFYLMHVKTSFGPFKKNGVYWVDQVNASRVYPQHADLYPASIIPKYTNQPNLLLVRSGGIGDIIALSAISDIAENTIILTQKKYEPLSKYFKNKVTFKHFAEPLFIVRFPYTVEQAAKSYGMMYGDGVIEAGSSRNWYEVLHDSIDFPFDKDSGRPQLKSLTNEQDDVCIVVPTASDIKRSADRDMLKEVAQRFYTNVIMADEQTWTFEQYLTNLDRAKFVISVDTSAIHFREGIGKPALGIYGAFSTDSRTKYYTHTNSIDIDSSCLDQACFKHEWDTCPLMTKESKCAPCLEDSSMTRIQITNAILNQHTL